MTFSGDYEHWLTHDLQRGHLTDEQKTYFEYKAVWLCARTKDVGMRNGRMLARMAMDDKQLIHKIEAEHPTKTCQKMSAKAFSGLRRVIHLVRGCKVMITRNIAYHYGLANGTRGTLVGVVYGEGGVGTFPEALIVDVPDYRDGPLFYEGQPTWVPILPMTQHINQHPNKFRTQFPVVAGFALTVNKAQGLTFKEGVVVHLAGGGRFRPGSRHGLPFVAFTRSTCFALTAFKNLPSFDDFKKGRESPMLHRRKEFEVKLTQLHRKTLAKHSPIKDEKAEEAEHTKWSAMQAQSSKRRKTDICPMRCAACEELWG
jgi:hypothetical protein